jgi:type I restriction enzyme R subunit
MHGNIVCFRNLKKRTDQAIRLFSDKEAIEVVTSQSYDYYLTQINSCLKELLELTPTVSSVDYLKDEEETKKFILIFRDILRLLNRIITFTEFDYNHLQITEQELNDYKSKYLDIYDLTDRQNTDKVSVLKDVDFEIELLRTDNINVAYIINLLRELDPESPSFDKDKKFIHDIMQSSHNLKSKSELIDNFITENIVEAQKPINIDLELPKYFEREKNKEIHELVEKEKVSDDKTRNIIKEYEYSGKFYNDEIKKSFTEPHLGFRERKHKTDYIKDKIINLVEKFALI